jgi:predicted GNAT family acetyltransferase
MDQIVDNAGMHRFEMAIGDDIAVAYYQEQDGRIVLLHTEVPQRFSGQGLGSRLARAVFDRLKARGRRVIAKCPFMASFATKNRNISPCWMARRAPSAPRRARRRDRRRLRPSIG